MKKLPARGMTSPHLLLCAPARGCRERARRGMEARRGTGPPGQHLGPVLRQTHGGPSIRRQAGHCTPGLFHLSGVPPGGRRSWGRSRAHLSDPGGCLPGPGLCRGGQRRLLPSGLAAVRAGDLPGDADQPVRDRETPQRRGLRRWQGHPHGPAGPVPGPPGHHRLVADRPLPRGRGTSGAGPVHVRSPVAGPSSPPMGAGAGCSAPP